MSEVKHRLGVGPDLIAATIAVAMPALLGALWLAPRPAIPREIPPLVVGEAETRASIEREHALAARAPAGADAERRRALYEEQNLAAVRGESAERGEARRAELRAALERLEAAHGPEVVDAIRAADVERMIPTLEGQGDDDARARALGDFLDALARWGVVVDGRRVAPDLVVRALFAARWNAVHGRPLVEGLDAPRQRAYHGWLALHGDAAEESLRLAALDAYEAAGGARADEARGVLAWRLGELELAATAFERAHAQTGEVRLRNHAIAATIGAAGPPDE